MIEDHRFEHDLRDGLGRLAAQAGSGPAPTATLARLRRRTVRRRLLAGSAGFVVVASGVLAALFLTSGAQRPVTVPGGDESAIAVNAEPPAPADPRAKMARLEVEIQARRIVVCRLQSAAAYDWRMEQLRKELDRLPAGDQIAREIDEVAVLAVKYGDHLRDAGEREKAAAAYEDVVRLFPESRYAADARQRLDEMKQPNRKGDT